VALKINLPDETSHILTAGKSAMPNECYSEFKFLNVGTGQDITIAEFAELVADHIQVGWTEPRFLNDFEGTPLSGYAETKHTRNGHIDQIALNA
jgi:nucleoside-diphosphate-sugar epimerase